MKTFAFDFTGKNFGRILVFNSRAEAGAYGNGFTLASDPEELAAMNHPTMSQMVEFYNHHNKALPVKKFTDRPTAAKRMLALAAAKALAVIQKDEAVQPEKALKTKKEKVAKVSTGTKGRKSEFSGKRLSVAPHVLTNYRRAGTGGFKSMEIIFANPGISTEDFLAAGGRLIDLRWDLNRGSVIVE